MNKSVGHGRFLCTDLSKLVVWAHTHGAICSQIPALEIVQNTGHRRREDTFQWMCGAGHAYFWQCGELDVQSREEAEGVKGRKKSMSSEASSRKNTKRLRMTPSLERAKANIAHARSQSRSPALPQKKDGITFAKQNEPSPRENQTQSTSGGSVVAAGQQHLAASGGTERYEMKTEYSEEPLIILDEEECALCGDDQADRITQSILLESQVKGVTAEVALQQGRSWTVAFNQLPATQGSSSATPGKSSLTPAYLPKFLHCSQESLDSSSSLRLSPLNPTESRTETCTAPKSSGSAVPEGYLEHTPFCSVQPEAQPEPPTSSPAFFEVEAAVHVQKQQQLRPSGCNSPATGLSRSITKHAVEEAGALGSGRTPQPSTWASESSDQPPAASGKNVVEKPNRKKNHGESKIRYFKNWLAVHYPAETREIHKLLPEDLDSYLALFYASVKRQDGGDFSAGSFNFFQLSIMKYLEEHGYGYSLAKGLEFRASQEALKKRVQHLSEREREGEWSLLENLTEEDMGSLRERGILSKTHPQGLLLLMLVNIIRAFGAHTHSQGRSLHWGQLVLGQLGGKLEFLEWKDDLDSEESGPRLFANPSNPESCPVADYKEYAKRRPVGMCHSFDPLYLVPRIQTSAWLQEWYYWKSLTRARLEKMLKTIVQQVKRSAKKPK